jgi:uncharacterized membrane protein YkoI
MSVFHKMYTAALALGVGAGTAQASDPLLKQARVSEAAARATALARVPGGTVKSHELETESGRLIWTFDIATPAAGGVTEVHVDARSGRVIAVKRETSAEEAAEASEEEKDSGSRRARR